MQPVADTGPVPSRRPVTGHHAHMDRLAFIPATGEQPTVRIGARPELAHMLGQDRNQPVRNADGALRAILGRPKIHLPVTGLPLHLTAHM